MEPDTRYRGRIIEGSHLFTSGTGTAGYKIMIGFGEREETEYIVWLTERNRDKAIETFGKFGVRPSDFVDDSSVIALASRLTGKNVKFGTKGEEYKGAYTVKVSWIDADKGNTVEASPSLMLAFFKGSEAKGTAFDTAPSVFTGTPIDDSQVPF